MPYVMHSSLDYVLFCCLSCVVAENQKCRKRECDNCYGYATDYEASSAADSHLTFWWEWNIQVSSYEKDGLTKPSRIMKKHLKHGTVGDLKKAIEHELKNVLCPHVYNIHSSSV